MRDRLAEAIHLRETGRAKQDQAMLEEARTLLLELVAAYPNEAEITYQTAIVHDNLGRGREALPFYRERARKPPIFSQGDISGRAAVDKNTCSRIYYVHGHAI